MNDVRVTDFPIAGLEYLFVPRGLPLVAKTSEAPATTSILIRGGAGTGKTTLAVALAHAIGREQGGVALYLTTEFVATELAYKADSLDLAEGSVDAWSSKEEHQPGDILAEHLLGTPAGEHMGERSVAARKRAAIDAISQILMSERGEPSAERPVGPPVRAVVIDAFGLPNDEHDDDGFRNDVLELIQSLEQVGITTILVEEAGTRAEAWLPFVVDVVFEIDLWPDPDTGDLARRLSCPKSRYGRCLPGPHDYGLDGTGVPAAWPDLAFSADAHRALWDEDRLPPTVLIPFADQSSEANRRRYVLCDPGSVIVSDYAEHAPVLTALTSSPGIRFAWVDCGPLTFVALNDVSAGTVIGESQGVFALSWELIRAYQEGTINSVLFQDLEFFLARPRQAARTLRMLSMLSAAGLSVCLHGDKRDLDKARTTACYVQGGKIGGGLRAAVAGPMPRRADRWIAALEFDSEDDRAVRRAMLEDTTLPSALCDELSQAPIDARDAEAKLQRSVTWDLLGPRSTALNQLRGNPRRSEPCFESLRFTYFTGDGIAAARESLRLPEHPAFPALWSELSAIYAHNPFALEDLAIAASAETPRQVVSYMRALARAGRFDELTSVIDSCRGWFDLPSWTFERLGAEYHLDVPDDPESLSTALAQLVELSEQPDIPQIHLAEIVYNIGVAKTRQNDTAGARAAYRRANEINPLLEIP
jgi:KaiC/GvpD/RAD55 family RecA-like ATPase